MDRSAAAVACQVVNGQLRLIEIERRIREADELEGRLDGLRLVEEAERRAHVPGW